MEQNILIFYRAVDTIRTALAMGADWGIHVTTEKSIDQEFQPLAVAKVFEKIMEKEKFDMCILGKQAIDDDYVQTGQILGSRMNIPTASFASFVEIEDGKANVLREVDFGLQKIEVKLPAVFTCDLRLNTPRFANVKSILKAKKKRVDKYAVEDLDIDFEPRVIIEEVFAPEERAGGVLVSNVDELVDKLMNEAKVI